MGDSGQNDSQTPGPEGEGRPSGTPGFAAFKTHVVTHKVDVFLWATRMATIGFTLGYFMPFFGNPYNAYYKALMANAATSALRLHQRLPRVQLTREFMALLLMEDSCHYLFFSLIFLFTAPATLVILPVFLFALLHAASYSLTLLDTLGQNSWWGARLMISLVELQSRNILRVVAFTEIFLMPFSVIQIFAGRTSLLTPFVYYHFLTLRYSSRRNPYTRNMFHELRMMIEGVVNKPACPGGIRNVALRIIDYVSRLAPPMAQAQ